VASARTGAAARERIETICATVRDAGHLRRDVLSELRGAVAFDSCVWLLTDPVSAVGAAPLAEVPCLPELPALIRSKYATPVNRWTELQRASQPVGLLAGSVGGRLDRSRVWREVMSRYGIGDVASVVFADQFGCWGFLDLWRADPREDFSTSDADFIASITPTLTAGLRACQASTFVEPATPHRHGRGPVVLTLDDDLRIMSRTAATQQWIDLLLPPKPDERSVPASVYNVAAQLLAVEEGTDDHPPFARTHLADGFWLALRAARLAVDDAEPNEAAQRDVPALVVTIEEASALERLDLFGRAFGFTGRENDLLRLLAVGSDTRAMARQMRVSEHTVQDHLKSIFGKTDARDRISVLSRALGTRTDDESLAPDAG
jgi:DNA-binding CsgD family transcriptional regulator